jgi:hypothetical protein
MTARLSFSKASSIPTGPKGEKRPADVIGNAVHVMRIASSEIEETVRDDGNDLAAQALGKNGGGPDVRLQEPVAAQDTCKSGGCAEN